MKGYIKTQVGNVSIDTEVIAQYAGSVAVECFGIVGMASVNVTDGIVKLLKNGVSIKTVCDNLISSVKYKVEEFTGLDIEKINIYVEGVRVID